MKHEPYWTKGQSIQYCGPETGNTVKNVAFCECNNTAEFFTKAVNSYYAMREALDLAKYKIGEMIHIGCFEENEVANFNEALSRINEALEQKKGK